MARSLHDTHTRAHTHVHTHPLAYDIALHRAPLNAIALRNYRTQVNLLTVAQTTNIWKGAVEAVGCLRGAEHGLLVDVGGGSFGVGCSPAVPAAEVAAAAAVAAVAATEAAAFEAVRAGSGNMPTGTDRNALRQQLAATRLGLVKALLNARICASWLCVAACVRVCSCVRVCVLHVCACAREYIRPTVTDVPPLWTTRTRACARAGASSKTLLGKAGDGSVVVAGGVPMIASACVSLDGELAQRSIRMLAAVSE